MTPPPSPVSSTASGANVISTNEGLETITSAPAISVADASVINISGAITDPPLFFDRRNSEIPIEKTNLDPTEAKKGQKSRVESYVKGLLFVGIVFLLREGQAFFVPVVVAIVFTFLLSGPVRWLHRHKIPEVYGAGILIIALLASCALLTSSLLGPATQWWERLPTTATALAAQIDRVRASIPFLSPPVTSNTTKRDLNASPPADPLKEKLTSEGVALTGVIISHALSFTLSAVATVLLLYFLLSAEHWVLSRTVQAIPYKRTRALVISGVRSAQREIGRFLTTLSIINIGVGVATGFALSQINLPNPILWGTIAGVLNFIPYIGPIMILVLLTTVGLTTYEGSLTTLAPPLCFMAIHAIESNFISPWFVGRRLALSRVSVFLSVMFWGWVWGLAGAMLAVPLLIVLRNFCKRNKRYRWLSAYLEDCGKQPASLVSLMKNGKSTTRRNRRTDHQATSPVTTETIKSL